MNSYKLEFYKRRAKDKDKWKKSLEEEIERIKNKYKPSISPINILEI